MTRVLLLQVGSTVPRLVPRRGDFDDWFRAGVAPLEVHVVRPHEGDDLPEPRDFAGVMVTGSSAMVTEAPAWSAACERWLADAVRGDVLPVLGVCYGHQLLARGMDGEAGWNENGREIGTIEVQLTGEAESDPLFAGLPTRLAAQATHSQSVLVLPPGARRLAFNAHDANQAFALGERAWGVQFHPEFDADIIRGYVEERRADIAGEGLDPDAIASASRDSPDAARLLTRFAELVRS